MILLNRIYYLLPNIHNIPLFIQKGINLSEKFTYSIYQDFQMSEFALFLFKALLNHTL